MKHDLRDKHAVLLETDRSYRAQLNDTVVVNLKGYDRSVQRASSGDGNVVTSRSVKNSLSDEDESRGLVAAAEKLQVCI